MYVPVADFSHFTHAILDPTKFPDPRPYADGTTFTVYWNATCDTIRPQIPNYDLTLELYDSYTSADANHKYTVTLKKERMTIDGKYFGDETKCYMPIFADIGRPVENSNDYYLGAHTMYEEYVVYDNTGYVTKEIQYA